MADIYIRQSADIAARTLGDDTVIMSTVDSTVFMLNSVGTAIWGAADGTTPLAHIVEQRVCSDFEVSSQKALEDAKEFVEKLAAHGILQVSGAPLSSGTTV